MTEFVKRVGRTPKALPYLVAAGLALAIGSPRPASGKLETWRQETTAAFSKGHREQVVVSENGRVRLGQALKAVGKLDAARAWDLARTSDGTVYAATGDSGKVFRREPKDDAPWTLAYDASDTQALALAVRADGHVFVGTGPSGEVIDITDSRTPVVLPRLAPDVRYIWDLAADAKGNLYAATGPTGQLWQIAPDGRKTLILDSKHSHLLCVAIAPDGAVYAGSDGEGLVYRVGPDGKPTVVYDAPQNEVRTLLFSPEGILYAGTAAESSGGSGRGPGLFGGVGGNSLTSVGSPRGAVPTAPEPPRPAAPAPKPPAPTPPAGGSASPRPVSAGDNAVYRIGTDGVPREVFRARVLVFALAWRDGRLLVGTGPEGQLYEVNELERESAPIARLDHGQVLALLSEPRGGLLVAVGDPGGVVRLEPGHVATGTLVSDVLDAKLPSRFGALTWRAELAPGTSIALQVRTGNVGEPDSTWSPWSPEQSDPESSQAHAPPGRFAQYRATLSTRDPSTTPELHSVALRYQTANLAPEITKIDVPDVGASDGAVRHPKLTLRWDVSDPNGDDMSYTLQFRKEGWPEWVKLGDEPLTSTNYEWDTTSVPTGHYRVRVTASDRPSNNPDDALTRDRTSETFLIDHDAPTVTLVPRGQGALATLKDSLTRLVKASYALDGGDWTPVFPDDGLFDSPRETIAISLPDLKPGSHLLVVRTTDAAGNVGSADLLLEVR